MTPIRILVADDHALVREGITSLLVGCPEFQVVAQAEDGVQAMQLFRQTVPDVALLDLRMPKLDGPEVIARLVGEAPKSRFIVLTTYDTAQDVKRALQAGAHGYVLKGAPYAELVTVIKDVFLRNLRRVPPELVDRVLSPAAAIELSGRERQILRLVALGRSNAEIAEELSIAESTVKNHVTRLFGKLGVSSRTQATREALQRGLIRLD